MVVFHTLKVIANFMRVGALAALCFGALLLAANETQVAPTTETVAAIEAVVSIPFSDDVELEPATTTTASTTTVPLTTLAPPIECSSPPDLVTAPDAVVAALQTAAADAAFEGADLSASIWIEGWGEVLAINPDLQLIPASNQKLLVAIAAYELLEPDTTFRTSIDVVGNDLILRASADPTLSYADINRMAQAVALTDVSVDRLLVDVSSFPQAPEAPGWLDWDVPQYVGPLSGLMVDNNRWSADEDFLDDPALFTGHRIAASLVEQGIEVDAVEIGTAPEGFVLAEHESAPVEQILRQMLVHSDNQNADLLLMALGLETSGVGNLEAGADAVNEVLADSCVPTDGTIDDGSGLSRDNQRSAREIQTALRRIPAADQEILQSQLPVGGVSGTLANRFRGVLAGRVLAKTGTLQDVRALSGYTTTNSGRQVIFSILVNGEPWQARRSLPAIDRLVVAAIDIQE